MHTKFWSENLKTWKTRHRQEDNFKMDLRRGWTGLLFLSIGTSGKLL
jgi:hypothetical protein